MRIHTAVQSHMCTSCGKVFINKASLKVHIRIHTGEKPYSCSECDQKFADSTKLKAHERTHTGEMKYLCNICGKGFAHKSVYNRHMLPHVSACGPVMIYEKQMLFHMCCTYMPFLHCVYAYVLVRQHLFYILSDTIYKCMATLHV
jgi:DNA-directed RNA polymerase subunit RPC12/RpoP